jgi:hypothetical protein
MKRYTPSTINGRIMQLGLSVTRFGVHLSKELQQIFDKGPVTIFESEGKFYIEASDDGFLISDSNGSINSRKLAEILRNDLGIVTPKPKRFKCTHTEIPNRLEIIVK